MSTVRKRATRTNDRHGYVSRKFQLLSGSRIGITILLIRPTYDTCTMYSISVTLTAGEYYVRPPGGVNTFRGGYTYNV